MTEPLFQPTQDAPPVLGPRRVVGVQFRRAAAVIHDFAVEALELRHDTRVVVEAEQGEAIGWTVGDIQVREPHVEGPLRRIVRVATDADLSRDRENHVSELDAVRVCAKRARELGLPMKVVAAEWQHSGGKVTFYFSSEDRVDFRGLVRELAQKFRSRIEMRQVGPRDEAKIIGAMGPCGRETCCSSWLRAFAPVSIKMAKDQGLALNPQKVTGVCGRLLCCLAYEQDTYRDLRRKLPRLGKQVQTPRGFAKIIDVLVLRESVRVVLQGGELAEFPAAEVKVLGQTGPEPEADEPEIELKGGLKGLDESPVDQKPRRDERPRAERGPQGRPDRPRPERSREDRPPQGEQPKSQGERPQRPQGERPQKPQGERPPQQQRPQKPHGERPQQKPQGERPPQQQKLQGERPPQQQKPQGERPHQPRPPRPEKTPPKEAPSSEQKPQQPQSGPSTPQGEGGGGRNRRRRGRGGGGGGGGGAPPPSGGGSPAAS